MILTKLKQLFSKRSKHRDTTPEIEGLRREFKQRYESFQRLLASNNNALKLMAELEQALEGQTQTSMAFVRSHSTRIAVDVLQIVRHLNRIAPNKFSALLHQFQKIQNELDQILTYRAREVDTPLILPLQKAGLDLSDQVGGKMAALGELSAIEGAQIPDGFVITARAYRLFIDESGLRDEINRIIQSTDPKEADIPYATSVKIQQLILTASLPTSLEQAIQVNAEQLVNNLGDRSRLAMRSSALGEDGHDMSFAGQYHSELDVNLSDVVVAYKKVLASMYSAQAMSYRLHYGIRDDEVAMCVGCMPMIDAQHGGVIYTANPLDDKDDSVFIYAAVGLPQQVVDGSGSVETFVVVRGDDLSKIERRGTSPDHPLDDQTALKLAQVALQTEAYFGREQDIEWVTSQNQSIILLQSRPLTERLARKEPQPARFSQKRLLEGGVTASRGRASGPVFIARIPADAERFIEGSILVTPQPLPFWATLLGRANAVISEQGSVACHLANVAREYGVPAILGVEGATSKMATGDIVTVDADRLGVFAGHIEIDKGPEKKPRVPLKESPVYRTLQRVAKRIVPLKLLDPSDVGFVPEACETLHDITRFCHEMAVKEMFRFGVDSNFPKRAAKRLFTDVATQFWIIDLDNGISEEADDPYFVKLDQVLSVPMLALWRGMKSEEWKGPPPVSARGIMDVMFQSTVDPNLNLTTRSDYSAGNHFMIARNYCSLQSRLGYHYASVEALVGSRPIENYISFNFSGGGASPDKQQQRTRLIAELLETRSFITERKGEQITAQMGGYAEDVMERGLETLGYLLVHTRQLDMAMTDQAAYQKHKQKLEQGLKSAGL